MNTASQVISCISESNYASDMQNVVEPAISAIRTSGYFERIQGEQIYWERYTPDGYTGSIVISHGFAESCDKFAEMIYYFVQAGYQVFICEHRGHGRSFRASELMWLTHVDRFDDYIQDFHYFMIHIVLQNLNEKPLFLYAHSMGGAIGARYLELYPSVFDRAVLTAPMLELDSGNIPMFAGKLYAGYQSIIGNKKKPLFIHKPFREDEPFEEGVATSRARFNYYLGKRITSPYLQNSAATYQWMRESLKMIKLIVNRNHCSKVTIPVLLFQAEHDSLVKPGGQNRFISYLANGRLSRIAGSKHEIYRSENTVLQPYLHELLKFYNDFFYNYT
ncbi:Non-heme chloroperoxidase [compost metagenome]